MMFTKKRSLSLTSFMLLAAMLSGLLLSCAQESPNNNNSGATGANEGTTENQPVDTTEEKLMPNLPEVDYGGYTFTVLSHRDDNAGWDWLTSDPREIVAEEENGEPINDAVYKRNSMIKEKYNIEIAMITNTDERSLLLKTVNAGDDAYDAVIMYNNNVPGIVTGDLLTNVEKLPYVDLDQPWWDDGVKAMSVAHKNFLLAGDLLILDNEATNAMIFNKDMMANFGLELPYNLVKEGKWTMDKMAELMKGTEADLNGDGTMTYDSDRFGFVTFNDTLHALFVAGGGAFAMKDQNDIPYMSFAEPQNLNVLEKVMDLMYKSSNPGVLNVQWADNTNNLWNIIYYDTFMENRALFMWIRMRVIEVFRGMEANFGILPMPKYDENQKQYHSLVNPYTGVLLGVPKSASDLERTSVILEALCAESRYTLQPAYYDIALQRKFTRDEESSEMLDIIFSSRTYDIGGVYSFGSVFGDFNAMAKSEDRNIMSYYERKSATMATAINKLVTQYESMED